ncbi:MAG: PmoA family protein [Verrucomicrobiota bacterium]|nr:PmoA family protein [Verrucomicrobiota bacterium]
MRRFSFLCLSLLFTFGISAGETASVSVVRIGMQYHFKTGDRIIAIYQAEPGDLPRENINPIYRRGGYIHPLFTPEGKSVTDDFPTNHIHHHGVWAAWTNTEFDGRKPDFWNMGSGKGKVEFVSVEKTWNDQTGAGLVAEHRYIDLLAPEPTAVLSEQWTISVPRQQEKMFVLDLAITQRCLTAIPLRLPKYHYGGLGFRGRGEWNGTNHLQLLTSTGETNRLVANESRGRWCYLAGEVEGGIRGVLLMNHPTNLRHPQPMRVHPDEPFFCFAPSQLGEWEISQQKGYHARYRFVTLDGPPDPALFERLWKEYTSN